MDTKVGIIGKSLEINSTTTLKCTERILPACSFSLLARKPILFLGVACKPNVSDTQESPALEMLRTITAAINRGDPSSEVYKTYVKYYDPHVQSIQVPSAGGKDAYTMYSQENVEEAIESAGVVVVCVNHARFEGLRDSLQAKVNQKMALESELDDVLVSFLSLHEHDCEVFDFCGILKEINQ